MDNIMQSKFLDIGRILARLLAVCTSFTFLLMINGCAGSGSRGTIQRNQELNRQFLSYQVLPDYTYYFSGGYDKPNAILGIHKDYQLMPGLWQSVQITPGLMEKWIRTIAPEDYRKGGYFAAYILDTDGKRAGIWYSIQDSTTVKFPGDNKIEVYTPDLFQPGERDLPRRGFGRGRI
jgi:hypothetical protein